MSNPQTKHVFFAQVHTVHERRILEGPMLNPQTGEPASYMYRPEVTLDVRTDDGKYIEGLPGPKSYPEGHPVVRVTVESDWHGDTDNPEYLEVYQRNPVVSSVLRSGGTLEDVVVLMDRMNREQLDKLMELQGLTSRIYVTPDGKRMRWDCPDELVPVTDLREEN